MRFVPIKEISKDGSIRPARLFGLARNGQYPEVFRRVKGKLLVNLEGLRCIESQSPPSGGRR
jgi:hypothetical protein